MTNREATIIYFKTPTEFRAWLKKHHAAAAELHIGFFKTHTGTPSITWPESVAEALCYGWIDGIRRRVDVDRYSIRFTPRRPKSIWSAVNIRLIAELEAAGRMTDAGRAAFEARPHKSGPNARGYSAQKKDGTLDEARTGTFKRNAAAWAFFQAQPPGYRKAAAWWVMSAKQESTRDRRLKRLIETSAAGNRLT